MTQERTNIVIIKRLGVLVACFGMLIFFLSFCCKELGQIKITKEQAISLAENFIGENGYTKAKPNKSKISLELFDEESTKVILSKRRNTLNPKAYFISHNEETWSIGFLDISINPNKIDSTQKITRDIFGRAVVMDIYGEQIRMAHKEPNFSNWEKIK